MQLKDTIIIEPVSGVPEGRLSIIPKDLRVRYSPFRMNELIEDERHKLVGSLEDWLHMSTLDTFGFDADTLLIKLLEFRLPEQNIDLPQLSEWLLQAKKCSGIPKLVSDTINFEILPFDYRCFDMDERLLICFSDSLIQKGITIEWKMTPNLSLFFNEESYCAWGVYQPEMYLTDSIYDSLKTENSNEFLQHSFKKTLDLITLENVDKMEVEDKETLFQLADLFQKMKNESISNPNYKLDVLGRWITDVADRFYPEELIHRYFT